MRIFPYRSDSPIAYTQVISSTLINGAAMPFSHIRYLMKILLPVPQDPDWQFLSTWRAAEDVWELTGSKIGLCIIYDGSCNFHKFDLNHPFFPALPTLSLMCMQWDQKWPLTMTMTLAAPSSLSSVFPKARRYLQSLKKGGVFFKTTEKEN